PYGQPGAAAPQYGQQDPYGQPPSAGSASDPYAQGQQSWSPAAGSGAPASDPYGAPAGGPSPYGQSAYAQPAGGPAPQGQAQSRLVVGLLGIFLGGFGVHRFLLGYTKIGLIQVLVSVLSCFILYPLIQICGLIDGIMVLARSPPSERAAHGRPLTDCPRPTAHHQDTTAMTTQPAGPLPDRSSLQTHAIILIVLGFLCGVGLPADFGIIALVQMDSDPYSDQRMNKVGGVVIWALPELPLL